MDGMNERPAVVGTARAGTGNRMDQAGGPQENGSRHAAGTVGARNAKAGSGKGAGSGTRTTTGAAASAGVAANWQIGQCAASCLAGGGWWSCPDSPQSACAACAHAAHACSACPPSRWKAGANTSAQTKSAAAKLFHFLVIRPQTTTVARRAQPPRSTGARIPARAGGWRGGGRRIPRCRRCRRGIPRRGRRRRSAGRTPRRRLGARASRRP